MAETAGVEFFCYHRDRPGSMALRKDLPGRTIWDLPGGPDAARAVLTAGRYAAIEVHRWQFGGRTT